MCFSAIVEQDLKKLSHQFHARIDYKIFEDLFRRRLEGEAIHISRALEHPFIHSADSLEERAIGKLVREWRKQSDVKDQAEIEKQKIRFNNAHEKLKIKEIKRAHEDLRISSEKISKLTDKIEYRNSPEFNDSDSRIWPFWYAPMIYAERDELVIAPFRYHMRPSGTDESFDHEKAGCYNVRDDSLEAISKEGAVQYKSIWRPVFLKQHAVMIVRRFFENVDAHKSNLKGTLSLSSNQNIVVSFDPGKENEMFVPMVYDRWRSPGKSPVDGAAAITFDPTPEVAAAGHDRTIGRLKFKNVEIFLHPEKSGKSEVWRVLRDHESYQFKAAVA